jgi:CBS-domain-containing membrane protein
MSAEVRYCYEDDGLDEVLENMGELQVRRLPVLNRDKRLVGIVSLSDLAARGAAAHAGEALSDIARPGGEHSQTRH